MAPTALSKRSKPAFSLPRPGISRVTKSTKEKAMNTRVATKGKSDGKGNINADSAAGVQKKGKSNPQAKSSIPAAKEKGKGKDKRNTGKRQKQKQRGAGATMRGLVDRASDDDDDDGRVGGKRKRHTEEEEEEDDDDIETDAVLNDIAANMDTDTETDTDTNNATDESRSERADLDGDEGEDEGRGEDKDEQDKANTASPPAGLDFSSSPEPDFILAEVTHTDKYTRSKGAKSSGVLDTEEYPIPLPLVHRIMHAHFESPTTTTTLSKDAKALMGTYVGVFVKEAIRRCVDEKKERVVKRRREGGGGAGDAGWLEVEDLERVGCQLVLDF
ncbi:hypothetical protein A1O7_02189 [Cladophialophora yegresii CBS 114405]|uniref:Uncharacterized protein n=1 Tax=Cladophialophora yegresii CBS 114405 TaxID=1182544 RepID=W9WTV5_9EURO|nr:uncharacterized protein A1O7_02189 [Cladophialophora yegresii CBS 114405]EXJ61759.1 hypothetical protein A1O7_02189 [Cladophialophora yegresii CBS 114405]